MITRRTILSLAVIGAVAGCGNWPDPAIPGAAEARAAPWPTLVPLQDIVAGGATLSEPPVPPAARIAALAARAAALRGAVIDAPTRARMSRGVDLRPLQGAR